mmetsp:Transcript_3996/g.5223  ORF Transcript_3996/g.5223 Transcript_3996/m.5223 type:complete len:201 (+) Transcript_3996:1489-2091(+)
MSQGRMRKPRTSNTTSKTGELKSWSSSEKRQPYRFFPHRLILVESVQSVQSCTSWVFKISCPVHSAALMKSTKVSTREMSVLCSSELSTTLPFPSRKVRLPMIIVGSTSSSLPSCYRTWKAWRMKKSLFYLCLVVRTTSIIVLIGMLTNSLLTRREFCRNGPKLTMEIAVERSGGRSRAFALFVCSTCSCVQMSFLHHSY